jgi:sulfur carrier protein
VEVIANGRPVQVPEHATVADLLAVLDLAGRVVVVERNGEPVERRRVAAVVLAPGDRLEVVRAVAGG